MFSKDHLFILTTAHYFMVMTAGELFYHILKKRLLLDGTNFHVLQINPKALMLQMQPRLVPEKSASSKYVSLECCDAATKSENL